MLPPAIILPSRPMSRITRFLNYIRNAPHSPVDTRRDDDDIFGESGDLPSDDDVVMGDREDMIRESENGFATDGAATYTDGEG